MATSSVYPVRVEFGDCDPAQIAYFPNYFRWFDAATFHFFKTRGIPSWRELESVHGLIGFPVVDVSCRFLRPTTVGDQLDIHTTLEEWRNKSFVMRHILQRGVERLAEATENRVFAKRDPASASGIVAVPAPEAIRRLTS